jgi:enoyl-CoA hydratase/carnithine racemase
LDKPIDYQGEKMPKIFYEKKDKIAYITLNRPEKMNAIDREMNQKLDWIWKDFKKDETVWVAILSGSGGNFCAGFDIMAIQEEIRVEKYRWEKSSMFGQIRCSPNENEVYKPIITAMDGAVNGVGTWLALQGDIRISTEETSIGLGEARFNFPVEFSAFLTRVLPFAIVSEMLFTAKTIPARRLYELGVINRLVSREQLMTEAEKVAADICKCGPLSIRVMKELIHKGFDMDYHSALSFSASMIVPVVNTEDTKEAVSAFLEKRKPVWKCQ